MALQDVSDLLGDDQGADPQHPRRPDPFAAIGDVRLSQGRQDPFAHIGDVSPVDNSPSPSAPLTIEDKIRAMPGLTNEEKQAHINRLHQNRSALAQLGNELDQENDAIENPGLLTRVGGAFSQIARHPIDFLESAATAVPDAAAKALGATAEEAARWNADPESRPIPVPPILAKHLPPIQSVTPKERAEGVAETLANIVGPGLGVPGAALIGAAYSPDDPLTGAIVGGVVGKGLHETGDAVAATRSRAAETFKPPVDKAFGDLAGEMRGSPPVTDAAADEANRIRTSNFADMLEQGARQMPFAAKGASAPPVDPEASAVSDFEQTLKQGAKEASKIKPSKIAPLDVERTEDILPNDAAVQQKAIDDALDAAELREEELTRQRVLRSLTGVRRRPGGIKPEDVPADSGSPDDQANQSLPGAITPYDTPGIIEARQYSASQPETMSLNDAESTVFREKSASQHLANAIDASPGGVEAGRQAIIVIGGPGSGKTSTAVTPASQAYRAPILETDDAKAFRPEYDNGRGSQLVYREASHINSLARDNAVAQGLNFVWPTIGANPTDLSRQINNLVKRGYQVHLRFVDTPADVGARRAVARYEAGDGSHFVDPDFILKLGDQPRRTYEALKNHPGIASYAEIDNGVDGRPAQLIEASNAREFEQQPTAGAAEQSSPGISGRRGAGGIAGVEQTVGEPSAAPLEGQAEVSPSEPATRGLASSRGFSVASIDDNSDINDFVDDPVQRAVLTNDLGDAAALHFVDRGDQLEIMRAERDPYGTQRDVGGPDDVEHRLAGPDLKAAVEALSERFPKAKVAVTDEGEIPLRSRAATPARAAADLPRYPEGFSMGGSESRIPKVPKVRRGASLPDVANQYLTPENAAALQRGENPTSLLAKLTAALDRAERTTTEEGLAGRGQPVRRPNQALSEEPRYPNGTRRPPRLVTVNGLVQELVDLEEKRADAGNRTAYEWHTDDDFHSTEDGRAVPVATRPGGKGVSMQAKAFQNLEDYERIESEVMQELERNRGIPRDVIDELVNRAREAKYEQQAREAAGDDDQADTSFYFGGETPTTNETVRTPSTPARDPFEEIGDRRSGTNNALSAPLPDLPQGQPKAASDPLFNPRTWGQSPAIQGQLASAEQSLANRAVSKYRVPVAEGRERVRAMTRDALVDMGMDPTTMDLKKVGRLSGEEIVAFKQHATMLMDQITAISKDLEDPTIPDAERSQLQEVLDGTIEERDRVLERVLRASSQKGRDLAFLRQIANRSLDPDVWVAQARRLAGDRPLSDSVVAEIRKLTRETAEACGG